MFPPRLLVVLEQVSESASFTILMLVVVVEEEDGWVLGLEEDIILKRHVLYIQLGLPVML
jgi:hypothetical protein